MPFVAAMTIERVESLLSPEGWIRNFTPSSPIFCDNRRRNSSARQLPSRPSAMSLAQTSESAGRHGSGR